MVILFTFGCFVVIFTSFGAICHVIVGLSSFLQVFYLYFVYFVMGFYGVTWLILDSLWSFRIYLGYFLYFVLPFMFSGHVALCSTI